MIASKGRRSHGQSERKKYRQDHTEAKLNIEAQGVPTSFSQDLASGSLPVHFPILFKK